MKKEFDVVILCGGKGTRLYPLTADIPKPLVKIGDLPIIDHIIKLFEYFEFINIKLLIGYKGDKIKDYLEGKYQNLKISLIETGIESDTAERIWKVKNEISDTFFLTYSDVLADINLDMMSRFHYKNGKIGTMAVYPLSTSYGIVNFDENNIAYKYLEKPILENFMINSGYFIFESSIFDQWEWNDMDFSKGMITKLCKEKSIACYEHKGFWSGMDTVRENEILCKMWKSGDAKWAIWKK